MLRGLFGLATFLVTYLAACVDRPSGERSRHEPEISRDLATETCAGGTSGVVIYDPQFHTMVRPPHAGTFIAPSVSVGDRVAPRAVLAEVAWGPNRGKVVSPVGGVIVHAGAAIGAYIRENDAPFVVADPTRLAVRVKDAPRAIRESTLLAVEVDGIPDTLAGNRGAIDGASVVIALPAGTSAPIGAAARVRINCT